MSVSRRSLAALAAAVIVMCAGAAGAAVRDISEAPRAASHIARGAFSVWDGSAKEPANDGSTYTVTSAAELAWFASAALGGGSITIDLKADLDLSGREWRPIYLPNVGAIAFKGNGHTIRGLNITKMTLGTGPNYEPMAGLFGAAEGSIDIESLRLTDVYIDVRPDEQADVGALVGKIRGGCEIRDCFAQGTVRVSGDKAHNVGGLVGEASVKSPKTGGVFFQSCAANMDVAAEDSGWNGGTGGIVGYIETGQTGNTTSVTNCAVYGSVRGAGNAVGGVIGWVDISQSTIPTDTITMYFQGLVNEAKVTKEIRSLDGGNWNGGGGILGVLRVSNFSAEITDSVNRGPIEAIGSGGSPSSNWSGVGGIVGMITHFGSNDIMTVEISRCANLGPISCSATAGDDDKRAAGGIAGAACSATGPFRISQSWNAAAISSSGYAGGLVGAVRFEASNSVTSSLSMSYNSGSVVGSTGAGGLFGFAEANNFSGGQKLDMTINDVYSSVVPEVTGGTPYGFFGSIGADIVLDYKNAAHNKGIAQDRRDGDTAYSLDTSAPVTFAGWDGYAAGAAPPPLDRGPASGLDGPSGIVLRGASVRRTPDGSFSIPLVELPDEAVRREGSGGSYSIYRVKNDDADRDAELATGLRVDGAYLFAPASAALDKETCIAIWGDGMDVPLLLSYSIASGGGQVRGVSVRGVPVAPAESCTETLWLEWVDEEGAVHSSDRRPTDDPDITWSIVGPTEPNWPVTLRQSPDGYGATLAIGAAESDSPRIEEHAVRVRVSYGASSEDIVYTRKFFAGSFPTQVNISPEQRDLIDSVNAVLARTQVSIIPGSFQPRLSEAHIRAIERRLAEGLNGYQTGADVQADSPSIYVLDDIATIEMLMRTESPQEETLPVCFECTDKQSANIDLDLSRLSEIAPEANGKIVLVPMTYSVTFERDYMDELFGDDADAILKDPTSDENLEKIFSVLVLHKRIKEGGMEGWYTRLVDGVEDPKSALAHGMLDVSANGGELTVRLGYVVINFAGEAFSVSAPDAEGTEIGYIIVPDGMANDRLIDPIWTNIWSKSQTPDSSSGGGGGCTAGAAAVAAMLAALMRKRCK